MRSLLNSIAIPILGILVFGLALVLPDAGNAFTVSGFHFDDLRLKGGRGGRGGGGGGSYAPPVPSGPSAEELRKQREEKDLREAADDANDKGVEFAEKGDWKNAIKSLEEALEYEPDDEVIKANLSSVRDYQRRAKALEEARSNLYNTGQGRPGAVFDTKGERGPQTAPPVVVGPSAGQAMSERARKDPRMIKEQKEMESLQAKRQELDVQRTKLAVQRNTTNDPGTMRNLTKELDKAEQAYQRNLVEISSKTATIEKLKRTIDAEVEAPAGK